MRSTLRVAWYRFRTTFAHRRAGYLAIVLLIGLIGGLALGAISGARRTQSSFPAFLESTDPSQLTAESFGVIWTPMSYFHRNGGGENTLRLSFSSLTPERIRSGVRRLAEFIEAETARTGG